MELCVSDTHIRKRHTLRYGIKFEKFYANTEKKKEKEKQHPNLFAVSFFAYLFYSFFIIIIFAQFSLSRHLVASHYFTLTLRVAIIIIPHVDIPLFVFTFNNNNN